MQCRCVKLCFMGYNKFTIWCGFELWLEFHTQPRTHDISLFCKGIMMPETLRKDSDEERMRRGPWAHFYLLTTWGIKLCCPDEKFLLTSNKQFILKHLSLCFLPLLRIQRRYFYDLPHNRQNLHQTRFWYFPRCCDDLVTKNLSSFFSFFRLD